MPRDDSRAQRFVRTWLGPPLATLVGIGSTVELAAMPIPAAEVQLPGPSLIQQSPGPHRDQQPAGTPRSPSADESKPDAFTQLDEALTVARERVGELSERLQQELAALREENQKLRAEIEAARAERGELETAKQAAEAHAAELTKRIAASDSARTEAEARLSEMGDGLRLAEQEKARVGADLARVQAQLATAKKQVATARQEHAQIDQRAATLEDERDDLRAQLADATARLRRSEAAEAHAAELTKRIAASDSARTEAEARLSEMGDGLRLAEQEKARVGADLAKLQGELASTKEQVAAAGQEQAQRVAALEDERDDLRTRLADVTARLGPSEAAKAQLESEVAELRQAARTAADDMRQLMEALAAIGPAAGPLETDPALVAESGTPSAGEEADREGRAVAAPGENVAAAAAPSQGPEPGSADADLQRTRTAIATRPGEVEGAHLDQRGILGGRPAVFPMLADLPPERRQHVQGLLADLPSKLEERGLMTTVPGELLFEAGSDEVQAGAGDTLAKVAELIGMYDDRQVLIIGHSDAIGDAADNRQLSERRAELVKRIFVDYFGLAADRLSTEGLGEVRPIASNATPEGQRANRRVEVLILN